MDPISAAEKKKYEKIWVGDKYRRRSPGELIASEIIDLLGAQPGETLIDYGCGPGKAAKIFQQHGLVVTGVDIAANCIDPNLNTNLNLILASLWDLPQDLGPSDWCFCCDVLEHLPPEKVDAVLAQMAVRTIRGGYLQPACTPDKHGGRLGAVLHLTVRPREWWIKQISRHFVVEPLARPIGPWGPGKKAQLLVWAK